MCALFVALNTRLGESLFKMGGWKRRSDAVPREKRAAHVTPENRGAVSHKRDQEQRLLDPSRELEVRRESTARHLLSSSVPNGTKVQVMIEFEVLAGCVHEVGSTQPGVCRYM